MRVAWVSPTEMPAGPEDLAAEGIVAETLDPTAADALAARHGAPRGFDQRKDVTRSGMSPRDESALAKEADEHTHVADEVRLVVDGMAVYDVLSIDGARWLRLWLSPGDAIVVPARRYHRLLCAPKAMLRYVEVFGEPAGLMPLYRVSDDATRAV
jgi:1,2-dihydroxy-3-keto-5-methylthiopentene dioxygenase